MDDAPRAFISGRHLQRIKAEMRIVGERFMSPVPTPLDPMLYDGKRLDVVVASMPGPQSFTERVEDHGVIDMTGVGAVVQAWKVTRARDPR